MEEQLDLFSDQDIYRLVDVTYDAGSSLKQRFMKFHEANPHVYQAIVKKALALQRNGISRFGIAAIFETLRYDAALQTGGDSFKLNNSYRAFYSRLIMKNFWELDGFFETRIQKSKTRSIDYA